MSIWWLTLVLTYVICLCSRMLTPKILVDNYIEKKPNKFFAVIACLILVLISGLRDNVGDTRTYVNFFEKYPSSLIEFLTNHKLNQEFGFELIGITIKSFITQNSQIYLLILSGITLVLIFITFYKYSKYIELAIFFFITAGNYLVSMNGVRQYLASAILFISFPLIYKKKWYIYLPLVIIVSTIHRSAFIFILLYFIVNQPAWGKITKIILAIGIFSFIFYPFVGQLIVKLIHNTSYEVYGEGILTGTAGGSNIMRSLVYVVPLVLGFICKNEIEKSEKYYNIIVNMSVLNFIFMLLSNPASWIFARYCMYFSLYMIILLCWSIKYFYQKERALLYYFSVTCFLVYYWYEMHVSLKIVYSSNFINI